MPGVKEKFSAALGWVIGKKKMSGREADAVAALARTHPGIVEALGADGAAILVGERAAAVPGLLTAVAALARTTGARLAWVPRRAGERGGIEAGCLPFLLPGGRPVTDAAARRRVARACFGIMRRQRNIAVFI